MTYRQGQTPRPLQAVRSEVSAGRRLGSVTRKHDASDLGGCVDLRPVPCIKNMKGSVPGLGPHVVGDGDMKVRVGLPPDEQEGNVGAPELDQTSRLAATSSVNW